MACKIISYGQLDLKHIIYPIISIIILTIQNIVIHKTTYLVKLNTQHFMRIVVKSFGKSLTFIPFLFFKEEIRYSIKQDTLSESEKYHKKEYINKYIAKTKRMKKNKYYIIYFNMIVNFLFEAFFAHIKIEKEVFFNVWIFDIIYIWILSYFILKNRLYLHHYFSIIIIVILGIIINIINLKKTPEIFYTLTRLSVDILFSLNLVLNKYLLDNLLFTEYEICFYEGLFSLVVSVICLIVLTKYDFGNIREDNTFNDYDIDMQEIIVLILSSISELIVYLFGLITIKHYTVFHIFIILILGEGNLYTLSSWKVYVTIIIYIFFFFIMLVFNEIIELNCFGLQKYTKKNIIRRAKTEYFKSIDNLDDLIDSNIATIDDDDNNDNPTRKSINEDSIEIENFKFDFLDFEVIDKKDKKDKKNKEYKEDKK